MKLEGLGLEQQEAMQEGGGRSHMCPFPGLSRLCWAWTSTLDPFARPRPKLCSPPPASHYLLHSGSRLGGWWGRGGAFEVGGGSARVAVDGL